jgi:hypothetical protein
MSRPRSIAELTIRDWFAGQALAGLVQTEFAADSTIDITVAEAYLLADEMMAQRDYHTTPTKEKNERGN